VSPSPAFVPKFTASHPLEHTLGPQPDVVPLHSPVSLSQAPNGLDPASETDVNHYFPENVIARIAYGPSGSVAERLDRETDRLVDIAKGVTDLTRSPVMDPATVMYTATVTDSATGTDVATVTDRNTVTDRANATDPATGTNSTTGTDPATATEPATNL
jgi:hypothetical protein